jgi:hypothetical protein
LADQSQLPHLPSLPVRLRVHPAAEKEFQRDLFEQRLRELIWFIRKLRELESWPPTREHGEQLASDLDITPLPDIHPSLFEVDVPAFPGPRVREPSITVYFWVDQRSAGAVGTTIWVLHGRRDNLIHNLVHSIKRRVLRRLHDVKGHLQDGGAQPP